MTHLTTAVQDLLVFMLTKEQVTYRTQSIFQSRKFYTTVSFLKKNGYIRTICCVCKANIKDNHVNTCGSRKCESTKTTLFKMFELTLRGELVAGEIQSLIG